MVGGFSIRTRLRLFGGMALVFVSLVGGAGLIAAARLSDTSDRVYVSGSALRYQLEADMMHDALRGDVLSAIVATSRGSKDAEQGIRSEREQHAKRFEEALHDLDALALPVEVKAAVDAVRPKLRRYLDTSAKSIDAAFNDPAALTSAYQAFEGSFKEVEDEMESLSDKISEFKKATQSEAEATRIMAQWAIGLSALVAVIVVTVFGTVLTRSILGPIQTAVTVAKRVAEGDLTADVDYTRTDEVGELMRSLRQMNDSLNGVVQRVRAAVEAIATSSRESASGSADLSNRSEKQASRLQQTATSVEQLTSAVQTSAGNASQAQRLADSASQSAEDGGKAVSEVVSVMDGIAQSSRRISDIIGVIDSIAFQTNILALNAAVEAARAGKEGRGFAVVAAEVRLLAQRCGNAAKEIRGLIEASSTQVAQGGARVAVAGQVMNDIVNHVHQVRELINEITAAAREQESGIKQVNLAVGEIDQTTQQNAAMVEQSAASAQDLSEQAAVLADSVSFFKTRRLANV